MRVISFNAEGIISAESHGFFHWFQSQDADVLCLQDIRASEIELQSSRFLPEGYYSYCCENYIADDKRAPGGVAIYSRIPPKAIITGTGSVKTDSEGRYIQADFNSVSISSLLVPGEVNDEESCQDKYSFLDNYLLFLKKQNRKRREVITCGTFNIAHTARDVAEFPIKKHMPGALPAEQQWMDHLISQMQYVDCYREVERSENQFSFWDNDEDRKENLGWRTDYQIATQSIRPQVLSAGIYTREYFSRHAPVIVDYEWDLAM